MSFDLREKEEEYRAINQQLELKTQQLLEEANHVIKIQDSLLKQPEIFEQRLSIMSKTLTNSSNDILNVDYPQENVKISKSKEMMPFLKTKIKTMQCDYEKLQQEFRRKSDEVKKLQKDIQTLSEEKEKWLHLYNTNKTVAHKLECQLQVVSSKLQARENENLSLKKEADQLKKELRNTVANFNAIEAKMNKLTEELEKTKGLTKIVKQEEKDNKEFLKKQICQLNSELKKNERNKLDFISGFKKQLQLIDNLKKQKTMLEALKFAEVMDKEFFKLLEWKVEE